MAQVDRGEGKQHPAERKPVCGSVLAGSSQDA